MSAFKTELDIANRALQHMRRKRISTFNDPTDAAQELKFAYSRIRDSELRSNLWRFATRRTMLYALGPSTLLWTPPNYAAGTTYSLGQVVVDTNGDWWQSLSNGNVGNTPGQGTTGSQNNFWKRYFGQDTCTPFLTTAVSAPAAPSTGSSVAGAMGARTYLVKVTYVSSSGETVASGETTQALPGNTVLTVTSPAAASGVTAWNVYVTSGKTGTEVRQNASPILIGNNFTEPTTGLIFGVQPPVTVLTSVLGFFQGDLVSFNDTVYMSLVRGNNDIPPTENWLNMGGTTAVLQIIYPIGTGPAADQTTLNAYRLPRGFIRQAPSSPKGAFNTWLGMPRGNFREDWVFEGDYLISSQLGPVMLRYVADMVDVPDMDSMFCEMLSSRMAEELAPVLEGDPKMVALIVGNCQRHYAQERLKAVQVNGIEIGPVDADLDDYISSRA